MCDGACRSSAKKSMKLQHRGFKEVGGGVVSYLFFLNKNIHEL